MDVESNIITKILVVIVTPLVTAKMNIITVTSYAQH